MKHEATDRNGTPVTVGTELVGGIGDRFATVRAIEHGRITIQEGNREQVTIGLGLFRQCGWRVRGEG